MALLIEERAASQGRNTPASQDYTASSPHAVHHAFGFEFSLSRCQCYRSQSNKATTRDRLKTPFRSLSKIGRWRKAAVGRITSNMSQTQSAMAASFAELDGTCNMDATATSTSVQLDSNALYELSPSASMPAELGSDTEEALQSTVMVGRSTERSMVEPLYNFAPLVSPMSSMDQSQPSTHTDDWYTSQSSAISAFPTETSLSLTDDGRSRSAKDFVRPKLPSINTTWLCPPASDQPTSHVTESPEDISAADRLRTETLIGSSQDPTLRSRHYPAELTPPSMPSPGSFDDILMDIDALPEQHELETAWADRHPFILGNAANATATGHRYVSQGGYKGASPSSSSIRYTGTSDEQNAVGRLLAACEDYASILHEDCPNAIVDYLRKIFFSTRSYCQEKYTQSKPIDGVDLEDFWPSEPSIESGLEGLHDLMTEGWSTSHRLVSLLFLSFSLICVSLSEDQDLELAVLCLHQSARSWADFVYDPVEALFLPDFVDNLWELVEHKDLQLHVPSLGQSSNSLQDLLSAYVLGRRDFVLEIATTFIDVTLAAGIRACSQGTQAPNCVVEAPPSYADALHEPVLIPLACEAALEFPGCSTAYTALNQQLDADIATHQPTKPDHVLGILRDHDSQKDPIDTTSLSIRYTPPVLRASFSYLAKASRWMLTTLQRSAHRVASDPVELTPPRRSATAPDILEGVVGGSVHVHGSSAARRRPSGAFSSGGKQIQRSRTRTTFKHRPEKLHSTDNAETFYCEQHNMRFTGKYARGAYHKHMTGTVAHNVKKLPCPHCKKTFPRPDHLKKHCEDRHQVLMTGRAGKYQFQDMVDAGFHVGKGKMRAVTW